MYKTGKKLGRRGKPVNRASNPKWMRHSVKHLPALLTHVQWRTHDFTLHLNPAATWVQSEQQLGVSVITQLSGCGRDSATRSPHPETSHIEVLLNPPCRRSSLWPGPLHYGGFPVIHGRTPLDDWSVRRTSTWQHSTLITYIHTIGGIRTHNLSRRATAHTPIRPRWHWHRHCVNWH
jgi:hypothetical protein